MVAPAAKREAVAYLQATLGMSERRACAVVGADRKSVRYRSCRADDGDLRSRLCELAQQRRRFGYRRLHILLRRDGITINRKKTQRLYREEGLTVRRRKGRKRAVGVRAEPAKVRRCEASSEAGGGACPDAGDFQPVSESGLRA